MQLRRVPQTDHAEIYASFLLLLDFVFLLKESFDDIFLFYNFDLNDKLIQEANNVYN